ncbi:MAG TPA: DegT/DnrJ/EryC1/StrS aminotransferase family protein [Thermoflexales bacterium]|nr:DegT/DnrJ/EryC1/StrS aminotransferase family protein [Thermoflexales bacterium]HQW36811.1 DegT/DnrJ/EryC1/StrS aminotransferase family protein [Thermoflexales bacterium]HQZ21021.1 DegT/DnrJ/EryC1/StrS aminotransferase family protein [Thermoflexales bacterium]
MNIPVNEPLLNGNERKYLLECLDTGWISSEGPFVKKFEEQFAARVGRKHGVAVTNGSAALDAAVAALQLSPGDEVILPAFTIISCAAAIVREKAIPVVVDCDPRTWNMDPARVEERITPRTKAIMVAHIYGLPTDMQPVMALAKKYNLRVIEDAAEMHGQTYTFSDGRQKPCGSFGDLSTFSFYPNKHITTGEGGMIVTDDDALAARLRNIRNLFFDPNRRYIHEELGYNLRMTNLQAALGVAQLERLDEFVARKRRMGAMYTELLSGLDDLIDLPVERASYAENIYWVYGITLKDAVPFDAVAAIQKLKELGVGARHFFWPIHKQPVLQKMGLFAGETQPNAERLAQRGFYIPSGMALTDEQIQTAAQRVKRMLTQP